MRHGTDGGEELGVAEVRIRQRRWGVTWWHFPSASRNPRSVGMWERVVAAVNLVFRAPASLPFYIARVTGAHQPYGLDAPDQGVFKGSGPIFGSDPWRSTPTQSAEIHILQ